MTRMLLWLAAAALLAGCGGAAELAAPTESPTEIVTLRPPGTVGPLVGFGAPGGNRLFSVRDGVASADGTRYFATARAGRATELRRHDPATGAVVARTRLAGAWRAGAASADGRFVALVAAAPEKGSSKFAVHEDGAPLHVLTLAGAFDLDGIAPDGSALFLVEHFADGRYAVRFYDLARRRLSSKSVRVKNEDEEMSGVPGAQVATPDGNWLLTLLTNTHEGKAFVHALQLRERYALCLDLPGGGDVEALRAYGLALDADRGALYAPNPALGLVSTLDLAEPGAARTTARFEPLWTPGADTVGAVMRGGGILAFANGSEIWTYDTATAEVRGRLSTKGQVSGVTVGRDALYAVSPHGNLLKIAA
jgi:outer membrane protein assembly factor BamB